MIIMILPPKSIHSTDEELTATKKALVEAIEIDTFDGKLHIEWDPTATVTPIGQLPFFIQYLKLGNRFEPWVEDCPLVYTSHNAPTKTDVLGTLLLSVLSGHTRYSHILIFPKVIALSANAIQYIFGISQFEKTFY